jgi:hypothetical protein
MRGWYKGNGVGAALIFMLVMFGLALVLLAYLRQ